MMHKSLEEREEDFTVLFGSIWNRVKEKLQKKYPETPDYFWTIPDKFIYEAVSDYCTSYPGDIIIWEEDK